MKLLYSGSPFCSEEVLKRLLLVADEIGFMDRPSVTFNNWGHVGHDTNARRIDWTGSPVKIDAIAPPSGPAEWLMAPYIKADINNRALIDLVHSYLMTSDTFASRSFQLDADYGGITGREIVDALRNDPAIVEGDFNLEVEGKNMFDVSNTEYRQSTFRHALIDASISVTTALIVAEETGLVPVADDPCIAQLLAMRSSDSAYLDGTSKAAPYLGLDIAKAVIPEEMLRELSIPEILEYREKSADAYNAWATEINRVAAMIEAADYSNSKEEISQAIATELAPQIAAYKAEMKGIRDSMFAELVKKVAVWEMPSLSLAYVVGYGLAESAMIFAGALAPAVPAVVDYFKEKRDANRKNSMSYLIKLSER